MNPKNHEIIECRGTPYEIGRQYGEAARENIRKSRDFMFSSLKNGMFKASEKQVLAVAGKYMDNVGRYSPDALELVKGIAEGSNISFQDSFALKCYTEIAVGYPGLAGGMCTSFAVRGPVTADGTVIMGQNVDWHPDAPVDLLHIKHADGMEQLALCLLGSSLYYMNSAGICNCANLTLCPAGPIKNHIPLAIYLWEAMRQHTFDRAMGILKESARGFGYYHLVDEAGNMAGIESIDGDYTLMEPENGMLVHANHYENEAYKKGDLAYTYIPDSFGRSDRLRELISTTAGSVTPEMMMEFLADHRNRPDSICSHVDETKPLEMASMSIASIVMVPKERKMFVAFGPPCENSYSESAI